MKKVLQKVFDQPFIKGFVRFYQSAESDITSNADSFEPATSTSRNSVSNRGSDDFQYFNKALDWFIEFLHYFGFVDLFPEHCLPSKGLQQELWG